jgi:hypothetical protein
MACTEPKKAWKVGSTKDGKQKLTFKKPEKHWRYEVQKIPCGKCISCKLGYSAEWAARGMHEFQTSGVACYITLTFNKEHIPWPPSIKKRHIQNFLKLYRKYLFDKYGGTIDRKSIKYLKTRCNFKYKPNCPIKSIACGEYGKEAGHRPHYHLIIFGHEWTDKYFWKYSASGAEIYRSPGLEKLWCDNKGRQKGYVTVQEVNYKAIQYVTRYTLKKQTANEREEYQYNNVENVVYDLYQHCNVDLKTGEVIDQVEYEKQLRKIGLEPEFLLTSKNIGKDWYNKYKADLDKDYLMTAGVKQKVPRYYDKLLEKENPEKLLRIKEERRQKALLNKKETTNKRLLAKATVKNTQYKQLKRGLDYD